MKIVFFKTQAAFRTWLQRHHTERRTLHVGFRKRHTGQASITWPEAVDEALCFGWIDGVRHRIDEASYTIRFTPRRPNSVWSTVNLRRVRALTRANRMAPRGLRAYRERNHKQSGLYSFEQRKSVRLALRHAKRFRTNRAAWQWFRSQAPWYRRTATFWVESAKQERTKLGRLATLISCSAAGRPVGPLDRTKYASARSRGTNPGGTPRGQPTGSSGKVDRRRP
jgi:uncharacterized protein YdeI (YjbR/CyaY-like superfamily)